MGAVEQALARYIDALERKRAFTSEPVKRACRKVKRHRFLTSWYRPRVDDDLRAGLHLAEYDRDNPTAEELAEIYSDKAIVTTMDGLVPTSSTSQPLLVARMLEHLELRPGMNVLEIGTGTGYNAALLAEIVGSGGIVCTVELQEDVAKTAEENLIGEGYGDVRVFCRDGYLGVAEAAPFDRIVATVGCTGLSPRWLKQLAPGGFMLLPLRHGFQYPLVRIEREATDSERATGRIVDHSSFMPIRGTLSSANPWRSYGIRRLPNQPAWSRPLPMPLASGDKTAGHPLDRSVHRAFHFFLSLSSRELWFNDRGYGLADPGSASVLVITHEAVEGFSSSAHAPSLDRLYDRLVFLAEEWDRRGRPPPEAFSLEFVPFNGFRTIEEKPGMEWIVEFALFSEIVRLPQDGHTTRQNG
jgi:protein-L-isoaspartate(D-aspartate) O-methyltransferase